MGNKNFDLETSRKQGNVQVKRNANIDGSYLMNVYLYDTAVVSVDFGRRIFSVKTGGWYTNSTRDVINRVLSEIRPDCRVYKKKNIWRMSFDNGNEESVLEAVEGKLYGF